MGGYIGSRAVNLSTTAADVSGNATIGGNLTVSGTTVTIDSANAQTVDLGDNDKIRMGDGDDLQLYHDATNSHISNATGNLTLDVAGDIILDAEDNGEIQLHDGGTYYGLLRRDNNNFQLYSIVQDGDMVFRGNDGGSNVTALTLDMSAGGAATFNSSIDTGPGLRLSTDGSANAVIQALGQDKDIYFSGDDGGSGVNALILDMSDAGTAIFNNKVGIGTSSPVRQLSLVKSGTNAEISLISDSDRQCSLLMGDGTSGSNVYRGYLQYDNNTDAMLLATSATERMRIDSSGNVNIGSTSNAGFGPLQLGSTSSASTIIQMLGSTSGNNTIHFGDGASGSSRYRGYIQYAHGNDSLQFGTVAAERMRIDNSGNLGIGTSSPAHLIDAHGDGTTAQIRVKFNGSDGNRAGFILENGHTGGRSYGIFAGNNSTGAGLGSSFGIMDNTANAYRMIIEGSAGHVYIGHTSGLNFGAGTTAGITFDPNGALVASRSSDSPLYLQRSSSDGNMVSLYRDTAHVGGIGVSSDGASFGNATQHVAMHTNQLAPATPTHSNLDNTISLGTGSSRFKDLYLSGGVYFQGSTTANQLDGYEEGTWTPAISYGNIHVYYASYIKIGALVTAYTYVRADSVPSNSTTFLISGLPFTSHNNSNYYPAGSLGYSGNFNTNIWMDPLVAYNNTYMYFHRNDGNTATIKNSDITGANRHFIVQVIYHVQI